MTMVDVDDSSLPANSQAKSVGLVWGLVAIWRSVCVHQANRVNTHNDVVHRRQSVYNIVRVRGNDEGRRAKLEKPRG